MKYAHVIHEFSSQPWAILPEKLHAMISLIELKAAGLTLTQAEIDARIGPTRAEVVSPSAVAVLPIMGTISHRIGMLRRASGGMSIEEFRTDFRSALRDPEIAAIVLDIDSPGGSTSGIEEMANEIFEARQQKRIIASVNSLAASAAYWLASAAHEIALTPSGHVGSIGVLGVHMDYSEKAKQEGVTVTVVSAGKYKSEASEFTPLNDEAKAHLQSLVEDRYDAFVRAVARGRNASLKSVREGFGEGRLVAAKEALALGMVDSVETMDSVVSRTAGRAARASKIAQAASWRFGLMGDEEMFDLGSASMSAAAAEIVSQDSASFKAQTLIAPKKKWRSLDEARAWIKDHGYRVDKTDETENTWRFRQRDPSDFQSLRTICINPGRDTPATVEACRMLMVGGRLKAGIDAVVRDADAEGVDEFLSAGVIPEDVSDVLAAEGVEWEEPLPEDFLALEPSPPSAGPPPGTDHTVEGRFFATDNFAGSPRNRYGTHASKGFKGGAEGYRRAWMLHFSQIGGGSTSGAATGPIRGTVRRVAMIAAGMKPPCDVRASENIGPRAGAKSPVAGSYPQKPSDYGLKQWAKPSDDNLTQEDIRLTCPDLNAIKRAATAEIKRRAKDREAAREKSAAVGWESLSDAERRKIAMHAAWCRSMPPGSFGEVALFHHRPSDGAAVPNGVRKALGDLMAAPERFGADRPRVEAHLRRHMDAIQKRNEKSQGNAALDPKLVELELLELA